MFPTHVGMNRILPLALAAELHVPHTHGDEPYSPAGVGGGVTCSPHTWG